MATNRLNQFEQKSTQEIYDWLFTAMQKYFFGQNRISTYGWLPPALREFFSTKRQITAFTPLCGEFDETPGLGLTNTLHQIPQVQPNFIEGLSRCVLDLPVLNPDACHFIAEFALRLPAGEILVPIEKRFDASQLAKLESHGQGEVDEFFEWVRDIQPKNSEQTSALVEFSWRVLACNYVSASKAHITWERLCEVDPDNWQSHTDRIQPLLSRHIAEMQEAKCNQIAISQLRDTITRVADFISPKATKSEIYARLHTPEEASRASPQGCRSTSHL